MANLPPLPPPPLGEAPEPPWIENWPDPFNMAV